MMGTLRAEALLALDSASTNILNSYFQDCKHFASDAQAIAGFNGPGPFKIDNNYLRLDRERLFGGADPKTPKLVPSDIAITRNALMKPLALAQPQSRATRHPPRRHVVGRWLAAAGPHYFKVVASSTPAAASCTPRRRRTSRFPCRLGAGDGHLGRGKRRNRLSHLPGYKPRRREGLPRHKEHEHDVHLHRGPGDIVRRDQRYALERQEHDSAEEP